jgi:hypothetical protein
VAAGSRFRREVVVSDAEVAAARHRLVRVAAVVVAADLVVKVATGPVHAHRRSAAELLVIALVVVLAGYALPLAGTRRIATAGGLMVGAGVGNLVSAFLWRRGVPNPFALPWPQVAFNLADAAAGAGFVLLVAGARRVSEPPPPPPRMSPPPPVRQTSPVRWKEPTERP